MYQWHEFPKEINVLPDEDKYPQVFENDNPNDFGIDHTNLEDFIYFCYQHSGEGKRWAIVNKLHDMFSVFSDYVIERARYERCPFVMKLDFGVFKGQICIGSVWAHPYKSDMYNVLNAYLRIYHKQFRFLKGTEYEWILKIK